MVMPFRGKKTVKSSSYSHVSLVPAILVCFASSAAFANVPLQISSMPVVSATTVVADDSTVYTVTMTASDADGYADIKCLRTLFDFTESGLDESVGRGYMAWGENDGWITTYGGTWTLADATGEGRWGYCTDIWGGTLYTTPLGCSTTTGGLATGGTGTRTVVWSFTAKPAWAMNPLTNDADAWGADSAYRIGWLDGPNEFDVVAQACTTTTDTPGTPSVSNPTANTLDVALDPGDPPTQEYAIRISPDIEERRYVQADGSVGMFPVFQTPATWGTVTVNGLISSSTYVFSLRAVRNEPGYCPSGYGPETEGSTLVQALTVNTAVSGIPVSRGIMGNATLLSAYGWANGPAATERIWEIVGGNSARGIAGGMDADTYNWKDMSGQGVGHEGTPGPLVPTTLMWMRSVRDYGPAIPVITVNTRGTGPLASSGWCHFYYTDLSVPPLATLAGDWVRYVNQVLPTYREGDTLPLGVSNIIDSIDWYGRPKLLSATEDVTPQVTYWEIGNEPELRLPWCTPDKPTHTISPAEYATRYKAITEVMLAADPTIKIGPCTIGETHSAAVLNDPEAVVDFVSYHPYGPLYSYANTYGDTPETAEKALRHVKQQQVDRWNSARDNILTSGRDPDSILLMASEWNPSDWRWECSGKDRRMSHAIGVAETIFTFAELEFFAAHYWSFPTSCAPTGEAPGYKLFQMMQRHLGNTLVDSWGDGYNFRMYTLHDSERHEYSVWGLNFSETADKDMILNFTDLPPIVGITLHRLRNLAGETSLFDVNLSGGPLNVDWTQTELSGANLEDLPITFPKATVSLLVLEERSAYAPNFETY